MAVTRSFCESVTCIRQYCSRCPWLPPATSFQVVSRTEYLLDLLFPFLDVACAGAATGKVFSQRAVYQSFVSWRALRTAMTRQLLFETLGWCWTPWRPGYKVGRDRPSLRLTRYALGARGAPQGVATPLLGLSLAFQSYAVLYLKYDF